MARRFLITLPNGNRLKITTPDDAQEEDVVSQVRGYLREKGYNEDAPLSFKGLVRKPDAIQTNVKSDIYGPPIAQGTSPLQPGTPPPILTDVPGPTTGMTNEQVLGVPPEQPAEGLSRLDSALPRILSGVGEKVAGAMPKSGLGQAAFMLGPTAPLALAVGLPQAAILGAGGAAMAGQAPSPEATTGALQGLLGYAPGPANSEGERPPGGLPAMFSGSNLALMALSEGTGALAKSVKGLAAESGALKQTWKLASLAGDVEATAKAAQKLKLLEQSLGRTAVASQLLHAVEAGGGAVIGSKAALDVKDAVEKGDWLRAVQALTTMAGAGVIGLKGGKGIGAGAPPPVTDAEFADTAAKTDVYSRFDAATSAAVEARRIKAEAEHPEPNRGAAAKETIQIADDAQKARATLEAMDSGRIVMDPFVADKLRATLMEHATKGAPPRPGEPPPPVPTAVDLAQQGLDDAAGRRVAAQTDVDAARQLIKDNAGKGAAAKAKRMDARNTLGWAKQRFQEAQDLEHSARARHLDALSAETAVLPTGDMDAQARAIQAMEQTSKLVTPDGRPVDFSYTRPGAELAFAPELGEVGAEQVDKTAAGPHDLGPPRDVAEGMGVSGARTPLGPPDLNTPERNLVGAPPWASEEGAAPPVFEGNPPEPPAPGVSAPPKDWLQSLAEARLKAPSVHQEPLAEAGTPPPSAGPAEHPVEAPRTPAFDSALEAGKLRQDVDKATRVKFNSNGKVLSDTSADSILQIRKMAQRDEIPAAAAKAAVKEIQRADTANQGTSRVIEDAQGPIVRDPGDLGLSAEDALTRVLPDWEKVVAERKAARPVAVGEAPPEVPKTETPTSSGRPAPIQPGPEAPRSEGHVLFLGDNEYTLSAKGDLYRQRSGEKPQFVAPANTAADAMAQAVATHEAIQPGMPPSALTPEGVKARVNELLATEVKGGFLSGLDRKMASLEKSSKAALQRLTKKNIPGKGMPHSVGAFYDTAEGAYHATVYGTAKLYRFGRRMSRGMWDRQMVEDLGDGVKPHLDTIWEAALSARIAATAGMAPSTAAQKTAEAIGNQKAQKLSAATDSILGRLEPVMKKFDMADSAVRLALSSQFEGHFPAEVQQQIHEAGTPPPEMMKDVKTSTRTFDQLGAGIKLQIEHIQDLSDTLDTFKREVGKQIEASTGNTVILGRSLGDLAQDTAKARLADAMKVFAGQLKALKVVKQSWAEQGWSQQRLTQEVGKVLANSPEAYEAARSAGIQLDGLRQILTRRPIIDNLVYSATHWKEMSPLERRQAFSDMVDFNRLRFSLTSFVMDTVTNSGVAALKLPEYAGRDLGTLMRTGKLDAPALTSLLDAVKYRATHSFTPLPSGIEAGRTAMGEPLRPGLPPPAEMMGPGLGKATNRLWNSLNQGGGQGTYTGRTGALSTLGDEVLARGGYMKGMADTFFKRMFWTASAYRIAGAEATRMGLEGASRDQFVSGFVENPPAQFHDAIAEEGNEVGFNRNLPGWMKRYRGSLAVKLLIDKFPGWTMQWADMIAHTAGGDLINAARGKGPVDVHPFDNMIGKGVMTLNAVGALYAVAKHIYPHYNPQTGDYIDPISKAAFRLSDKEPFVSMLTAVGAIQAGWSALNGDSDSARQHLRDAGWTGKNSSLLLLNWLGEYKGGVGGPMLKEAYTYLSGGRPSPDALTDAFLQEANRTIDLPMFAPIRGLIDPIQRRGFGATLPGVSRLLPAKPDQITGKPTERYESVLGLRLPMIAGMPVPGWREVDPVELHNNRFDVGTPGKGTWTAIPDIPGPMSPADLTRDQREKWKLYFGQARQSLLGEVAGYQNFQQLDQQAKASPEAAQAIKEALGKVNNAAARAALMRMLAEEHIDIAKPPHAHWGNEPADRPDYPPVSAGSPPP